MHSIVVGSTNIAGYIVDGSYDMDSTDKYESWQDGNYVEHRIIVTSKVTGSFKVVCSNETIDLDDFRAIFDNAADNGVVNMSVWVTNQGVTKAISAYYNMKSAEHIIRADGTYIDVITVEITER